jgi:phage gp29-like protein
MFKNAGFRFWMITAEKFGVPTVIAIFESDDEEKARQRAKELAEALSGIQSDAAIALGNVKEINTLEIKGNIDSFKVLIDACDNQISYAITGQNLASAEGKYGTRAQAEIHEKMLQSVAAKDAIDLGHTLTNQLIKYIVTLNFGTDAPGASIVFDTDEYAEWTVVKDAIQVGVPVSKRLLYTEYNIPEPDNDEDSFISPKASEATQVNMADIDSKKKLKRPYLRIS